MTDRLYEVLDALSKELGMSKDLLLARLISPRLPTGLRKRVLVDSAKEVWEMAERVEDVDGRRALRELAISYLVTAVGFTIGVEVVDSESEREAVELLALKSGRAEVYSCYVKLSEGDCAERLFNILLEYV